jgi:hypothetical protein
VAPTPGDVDRSAKKTTWDVMCITSRLGAGAHNLKENRIDNAALEKAQPCA